MFHTNMIWCLTEFLISTADWFKSDKYQTTALIIYKVQQQIQFHIHFVIINTANNTVVQWKLIYKKIDFKAYLKFFILPAHVCQYWFVIIFFFN